MLIEEAVFVFDRSGTLSTAQTEVKNIDFILITHEHHDHFDPTSIKICLEHNLGAEIITTETVSDLLKKEGIVSHILKDGESYDAKGVHVEAFGTLHAPFIIQYSDIEYRIFDCKNFFLPGDACTEIKNQ